MELIHFQGLNCFHDCVLSIANHFGLHYPETFATLWSETDFRYDPYREAYLTKRMIANLAAIGAKVACVDCFAQQDREKTVALFHEDELMIVGMDAFYIPWNQFHQTFHGPHYFIVKNARGETLPCFDPTYGRQGEQIARAAVLAHTFDIGRVSRVARRELRMDAADEAREVVLTHPATRQALCTQMEACAGAGREDIIRLAKYIDAMICNRYLYRFFLEHRPSPCDGYRLLFGGSYFSRWNAVKNGLYKAAMGQDKSRVLEDVRAQFARLMDEETVMAEEIMSAGPRLARL